MNAAYPMVLEKMIQVDTFNGRDHISQSQICKAFKLTSYEVQAMFAKCEDRTGLFLKAGKRYATGYGFSNLSMLIEGQEELKAMIIKKLGGAL